MGIRAWLVPEAFLEERNMMHKKKICLITACLSILLTAGCCAEPLKSGSHPPISESAWVVYWDKKEGMANYQKSKKKWDSLSYFALRMDEKGHFKKLVDIPVKDAGKPFYLTFVNDVVKSSGQEESKDINVLKSLLKDEYSRRMHAREILNMASAYGANGIDIDYEKIKNDPEVLKNFAAFTKTLYTESLEYQMPIRIILEPSVPMDMPYAEGPEYIVMLYNLYGTHGGPGPKANRSFIEKTIQKMEALPGKKGVAFSNGGCLWKDAGLLGLKKGTARFITEADAVKLARTYKLKPKRDDDSAALHFSYQYNGSTYEVWYADKETLAAWVTLAAQKGMSEAILWRLGS